MDSGDREFSFTAYVEDSGRRERESFAVVSVSGQGIPMEVIDKLAFRTGRTGKGIMGLFGDYRGPDDQFAEDGYYFVDCSWRWNGTDIVIELERSERVDS